MTALEVLGVLTLAAALSLVTWMLWVGLAGAVGAVRLKRCRTCGHLVPTWTVSVVSCPFCRHRRLAGRFAYARLHHYIPREW